LATSQGTFTAAAAAAAAAAGLPQGAVTRCMAGSTAT
jgi:hypothetical protein